MAKALDLDYIDKLRKEFADRVNELIQSEAGDSKLENFSRRVGVSMRQLSEWKNPRHINWPGAQNIIQLAIQGDISPTWLLLGKGAKHLGSRK
jgi:hypothetical protein